jgi:uncharacterized protein (TIGR00251 family)
MGNGHEAHPPMQINPDSLELLPHADGCILRVRARPRSRREGIVGVHDGALKVAVHAAPEKGKANNAIAELLSAALRIKQSDVTLLSGHTAPDKRFLLRGVTPEEVRSRIRK